MDHWGKAEDKRLLELARVHGNRNWEKIAAELEVCVLGGIFTALGVPHFGIFSLPSPFLPSCPLSLPPSLSPFSCSSSAP